MTDQASHFIGSIPGLYDRHLGPRIFHGYADDLATRAASGQPRSVLELAAGTGIVTRRLRDTLDPDCSILATDLNAPMLDVARQKFATDENVDFETADATSLPFADSSFDCIACQFGVMFFPDKQASYEEAARVLKPGGRYLFNVWGPLKDNPFAEIANRVVEHFFPEDPPGFYKVPFGYHDADEIRKSLSNSGFKSVRADWTNLESTIPSAEDFARGLVFGNPLLAEIKDRGGDPEQIRADIAGAIDGELGTQMPLRALVVEARLD